MFLGYRYNTASKSRSIKKNQIIDYHSSFFFTLFFARGKWEAILYEIEMSYTNYV